MPKSVLLLVQACKPLLLIVTKVFHILHNDCLWFVGETNVSNCQFDLGM